MGDLDKKWGIEILETSKRKYGWGFGKFEPLFISNPDYFLVLDADTALAGPILHKFEYSTADFVVDKEEQPLSEFEKLYYNISGVERLFPGFKYPGYSFNTGQWVGRSGAIIWSDLEDLIVWKDRPQLKHPLIFKQADQGLLNFLVQKKEMEGKIKVDRIPLMIWPASGGENQVDLEAISSRQHNHSFIIHWAGIKFSRSNSFPLSDIACFYENFYYSKYPRPEKWKDRLLELWYRIEKKIKNRLKKIGKS